MSSFSGYSFVAPAVRGVQMVLAATVFTGVVGITNPAEAGGIGDSITIDGVTFSVQDCAEVKITPETVQDMIGLKVHFHTDKCQINGDHDLHIAQAVAEARRLNPGQPIHAFVLGETDARASDDYNNDLGMRRARALRKALERNGVTVHSIFSLGESQSPQNRPNNAGSRNAFAFLGTAAQINACAPKNECVATTVVASHLRND